MKRYKLVIENDTAYLYICNKWCWQIIKDGQISITVIDWNILTDDMTIKKLEKK